MNKDLNGSWCLNITEVRAFYNSLFGFFNDLPSKFKQFKPSRRAKKKRIAKQLPNNLKLLKKVYK